MGIITITASKEEQRARAVELAKDFATRASLLSEFTSEIKSLVRKMDKLDKIPESIVLVVGLLDDCLALVKGQSRVLKNYSLPKNLLYAYNLSVSLQNAMGYLPKTKVVDEVGTLKAYLLDILKEVKTLNEEHNKVLELEGEEDLDDDMGVSSFADFEKYLKKLPAKDSEDLFCHVTCPVLATFSGFVTKELLDGKGIPSVSIAGYNVLLGVNLIGIHTANCAAQELDVDKVLERCIGLKADSYGEAVSLVVPTPYRHKKGGWNYYWVATDRYIDCIAGDNIDSKLVVLEFQFPF